MLAISVGQTRFSLGGMRDAREFVVSFPSSSMASETLLYGTESGRDLDKLVSSGVATQPATAVDGVLLADAVANYECKLVSELETGDHVLFVGHVLASHMNEDRAVRRWMENLEVQAWVDEPFGVLSDGQQRLVLLARALVKEPPLVILDEPCQGLDPAHRQRVLAILDQVAREPHSTVIYVTHHRSEIPASFGHELRLHRGRAAYCGLRQPAR